MRTVSFKHHTPAGGHSRLNLPPDLLAAASRRVEITAVVYAAAFIIGYFSYKLSRHLGGADSALHVQPVWPPVAVAVAAVVFFLARSKRISSDHVIYLGMAFGVVGSLLISLAEFWPSLQTGTFERQGISWTCVWIMTFPLLVPAPPHKTLKVLVAAALMGPAAMLLVMTQGVPLPPLHIRILLFVPNVVAAGIAFLASRIIYQLGSQVTEAREMGSYRLKEKLGEGGMGEVWLAEHRLLARPAAIKLIRPESLGDGSGPEVLRLRFEREAQATAALHSPHTIDLYDFGMSDQGVFFYVMELLKGMDLGNLVERFGPVSEERTAGFLIQACHSLAEAHAAGMIHRDIKPANLFTCRMGLDYDVIKILDFGLVKERNGSRDSVRLTQADSTSGTPAFMAPEQATGESEPDGRADLYALGCVGYWLLTGKLVFEADNPLRMIMHHVQTSPTPPSERTEIAVSPGMDAILLECLAKKPEDRPADAAALRKRLESLETRRPWSQERARDWWQANLPGI